MEQLINQLKTQFNAVKETFNTQEKAVAARMGEQAKNLNILAALKQELSELLDRTKGKLERGETLTADEYVELKQSDTGLKARIEYYGAVAEDFESIVYNEQKKLFDIQQELVLIRAKICDLQATEKLKLFIDKNQKELSELFSLLWFTGKYQPHPYSEETTEQVVISHLQKELFKNSALDLTTPSGLLVASDYIANFEPKRPTQIHMEQFQPPKGLARLLSQEMEK
ncbi:MAG: hypothetical protein KH259_01635 [Haemophilus paraphrohaemolyticus]|jgi:hypothetical protein|uniref:hypothetical protein n=1 Tax=Haemophilus TaxID=724 RepID=UPI001CF8BCE0|nr:MULTISPECIES: hypothetical protein [Haemophilus]MBS6672811.1 hypothetical protein [Haemophilus paraphrohaemolyticus]